MIASVILFSFSFFLFFYKTLAVVFFLIVPTVRFCDVAKLENIRLEVEK
jgi:hypothetical protein